MTAPKTLSQKVWDAHVVAQQPGEPDLLFIDLHLVHEVTSPQAFDGLRLAGRGVRHPELTIATEDHNVPTQKFQNPTCFPGAQVPTATTAQSRHHPAPENTPDRARHHRPSRAPPCRDDDVARIRTLHHGAFGVLASASAMEVEHAPATQTRPSRRRRPGDQRRGDRPPAARRRHHPHPRRDGGGTAHR